MENAANHPANMAVSAPSRHSSSGTSALSLTAPSSSSNALTAGSNATDAEAEESFERHFKNGCAEWSPTEEGILLRCLRVHGLQWPLVTEAFAKLSKGPPRSRSSLFNRYKKLQSESELWRGAGQASMAVERESHASHARTITASSTLSASTQAEHGLSSHNTRSTTSSSRSQYSDNDAYHASSTNSSGPLASTSSHTTASQPLPLPHPSSTTPLGPSPPVKSGRWIAWSDFEDNILLQCVHRYGQQWQLVGAEFAKAAPQNHRSKFALSNRYKKLEEGLESQQREGSAKRVRTSSSSTSREAPKASALASAPVAAPAAVPASTVSASHPTSPASGWTAEEEAHLLQVALQHKDVECLLDQVEAVWDDFRAVYPDTTRSLESLHTKYCQLLQQHLSLQTEAGKERSAGQGVEEGVSQGNSVDLMAGQEVPATAHGPHTGTEECEDQHNTHAKASLVSSNHEDQSATVAPTATAALPTIPTPPLPVQGTLSHVSPAKTLDYEVFPLTYGLRIERPPRNAELSIYSATHFAFKTLNHNQVAPAPASASASSAKPHPAAFVFHITPERDIVGVVLPPGTKTHPVVVGEKGERIGPGGGTGGGGVPKGVETHFVAPDQFKVVFYAPF